MYTGAITIIRRYWNAYGGWKAFFCSPYFHIALLITLGSNHFWMYEPWWDLSISILPNIIGFALGGYAIWLGFGDEKFGQMISRKEGSGTSPYLEVSATFAHFIVIQIIGLVIALLAKATNYYLSPESWMGMALQQAGLPFDFFKQGAAVGYGLGFLLLSYALMTALAATLAIFRVASWFDNYKGKPLEDTNK